MQPPAIRGLGKSNGVQVKMVGYGNATPFDLAKVTDEFANTLASYKKNFMMAKNTTQTNSPVLYLELDRNKAKSMGIIISDVYTVLQDSIGYTNINQFEKDNHLYWVQMQADGQYRTSPDSLKNIYVKNNKNTLIPVSEVAKIVDTVAPSRIEHFNGVLSNSLMAMTIQGAGTASAMKIVEDEALKLPSGYGIEWEGMSLQEKLTEGKSIKIFIFSILVVFLVLAIQYNSFILPFSVLLSVIFGVFGAFFAASIAGIFFKMPRDVYFSIGLLTMIALSSKNAILIVEFAEQLRKSGVDLYEATKEAAKIRYRPMMMTSIAFIFGILPLIFSTGAGAESRKSIGIGLLGGMIAATFIERYFIPYIYYFVLKTRELLLKKLQK
jgi:multidrug efflux pump subunit AcrB